MHVEQHRPAGAPKHGPAPRIYTIGKESGTLSQWADRRGITYQSLQQRIQDWGSLEKALTAPPSPGRSPKQKPKSVIDVRGDYVCGVVENSDNPDNKADLEAMLLACWDAGLAHGVCNPKAKVDAATRNLLRAIESELRGTNTAMRSLCRVAELLDAFKTAGGGK